MPQLTKVEAQDIAAKLKRKAPKKPNRQKFTIEEREGRDHTLVVIFYGAVRIGQYGIQRGKKGQGHGYIPAQILLNSRQAYDLAKCPFSVDDYLDQLIADGEIEDPDPPENPPDDQPEHGE